jgi:hypothetical protein
MTNDSIHIMDPKIPIYDPGSGADLFISWSPLGGVIAVVVTVILVSRAYSRAKTGLLYFSIAAWAVVPPAWFVSEFFFIYRQYGRPDTFELFKHGQQLSAGVWAGMLAALIALAATSRFKDKSKSSDDAG